MEKCKADRLIKKTNLVKTEAREAVLKIILESETPLTANDLHRMLGGTADLATVYRALKAFSEKGLVRPVNAESGHVFYEKSCEHNPPHAHFYCETCGKLECMKPFGFEESSFFLKMAKNRDINSVELILKGRCSICAV